MIRASINLRSIFRGRPEGDKRSAETLVPHCLHGALSWAAPNGGNAAQPVRGFRGTPRPSKIFSGPSLIWHCTIDRRQRPMSGFLCILRGGQEEVVMPVDSILFSVAVIGVLAFAGALFWADFHSRSLSRFLAARSG